MEVTALVGPSGTGKSHHASMVANEMDIPLIIDDGLLIGGTRILAGKSAKRENSALAAVRRAIFTDPEHAREVRTALARSGADKVLVLGTSRGMVAHICDALDLPHPARFVEINEIASQNEIETAKRIRRLEGKHVIPAPTLEVKRSFSGYLVHPLQLLRKGQRGRSDVIEKSIVRPTYSSLGRFYVAGSVVATIVEHSLLSDRSFISVHRVEVNSQPDGVNVAADVVLRWGCYLPAVLVEGQDRARRAVEEMTSLNVLSLNLTARRVV